MLHDTKTITILMMSFLFGLSTSHTASSRVQKKKNDVLAQSHKTLTSALQANKVRMRVAAENMANSQSPEYVPKNVEVRASTDRKNKATVVKVERITRNPEKMKMVYDPTHPKANAEGLVNMPNVDPLITLMDMQRAKLENEHVMKSYQMTTDMRHSTLKMMN